MAPTRKIKCDCGQYLQKRETILDHIPAEAMVCPQCGFTTLTKEQAQEFRRLVEFHQAIDQEKQVVRIGNSMGLILPEKLSDYGLAVGKKVRLEALKERAFTVTII